MLHLGLGEAGGVGGESVVPYQQIVQPVLASRRRICVCLNTCRFIPDRDGGVGNAGAAGIKDGATDCAAGLLRNRGEGRKHHECGGDRKERDAGQRRL